MALFVLPQALIGPTYFDHPDAIIVTHGRRDHIGDTVESAQKIGAVVIATHEVG